MLTVDIQEAKTNLSRLLLRVADGEEIAIAISGKPIARLIPIRKKTGNRVSGLDKGKAKISDDFDNSLPSGLQAFFE